jgi:GNAT superfamily N-acetyltransferase
MASIASFADLAPPPPGLAARCTALMAAYYAERLGLDRRYEVDTLTELARFFDGFDGCHDGFWIVRESGSDAVLGCAGIDGRARRERRGAAAKLRWVMLADGLRGRGLGEALLDRALAFCRARRYAEVQLHTLDCLRAAVGLYEKLGFRRRGRKRHEAWGPVLDFDVYALDLRSAPAWQPRLALAA